MPLPSTLFGEKGLAVGLSLLVLVTPSVLRHHRSQVGEYKDEAPCRRWILKPSTLNKGAALTLGERFETLRDAIHESPDIREWVLQVRGLRVSCASLLGGDGRATYAHKAAGCYSTPSSPDFESELGCFVVLVLYFHSHVI